MALLVTVGNLCDLHVVARSFLILLSEKLSYDLKLSLLIMALFMWLQDQNNDPFVIHRLLHKSDNVALEMVIREAVHYINFLSSDSSENLSINPPFFGNPLGLTIPIKSLYQSKYTAISGIKRYLRTTCFRVFFDILSSKLRFDSSIRFLPYQLIHIPGSPNPTFGPIYFKNWPRSHVFTTNFEICSWINAQGYVEDEEDRSLYVTFSHGFSVSKDELRKLFTSNFGDCVQNVDMSHTTHSRQVLFARLIMKCVEVIDFILKGKTVAKFKIRGKHVWAKKYKCQKPCM
ncbi:uncharacterized protein LOC125495020 [Beta vulgaris subsp. vulgaris]|uniref:uncharacterized protein LOC125495020 n=1 Tax=Beta vulgaris subsp. vulgaris TaxID=3555 RepID=UPI0020370B26|nr:uncharacterized protein LOC125495020 [Beta vulgaris subsp. vulgaris]